MFCEVPVHVYEGIIDFITNDDKPKDNEPEQIEEIFAKHYSSFMLKLTGKEKKYTFSKSEQRIIKTKLIPVIKMEMANNVELFGEISVGDFFDIFIINMDDFWKQNCFNIASISRNFSKIYHSVIIKIHHRHKGTGSNGKATMSDVMNDLKLTAMPEEEAHE